MAMTPSKPTTKRLFISTGEVSGDLQGALLIAALHQVAQERQISLEIVALGGDRMAQAGATLLGNTTAIGSVGIVEALPFLLPTLRLQRQAKAALASHPPDGAVLIDYMGPNLALGKYLKTVYPQVPITYYIAPQQWVWTFSDGDTKKLVAQCDRIAAIFQAEADYYRRYGAAVTWVGHPLVDRYPTPADQAAARQQLGLDPAARVVTLLPASRRQEVKYLMPIILAAAQQVQARHPEVQFLVPVSNPELAPAVETGLAQFGLRGQVLTHPNNLAIAAADVALAKSGTVNLEIALMNVPQVVAYRLNPFTAWIGRHLLGFSIPFASPVNLAVNQMVVPEFLQWAANPDAIAAATLDLLEQETVRQTMLEGYGKMRQALGKPGACRRAAELILESL